MNNEQWTIDNNGDVKEIVPIIEGFELKKAGVVPCDITLDQIDLVNLNGNATLKISSKTGSVSITSKRDAMSAKLWELLARVDPFRIENIKKAVVLLDKITTINPDAPETAQAVRILEALRAIIGEY